MVSGEFGPICSWVKLVLNSVHYFIESLTNTIIWDYETIYKYYWSLYVKYFYKPSKQIEKRIMTSIKERSPLWQYFDIRSDNQKFAISVCCALLTFLAPEKENGQVRSATTKNQLTFFVLILFTLWKNMKGRIRHQDDFCAQTENWAGVLPSSLRVVQNMQLSLKNHLKQCCYES